MAQQKNCANWVVKSFASSENIWITLQKQTLLLLHNYPCACASGYLVPQWVRVVTSVIRCLKQSIKDNRYIRSLRRHQPLRCLGYSPECCSSHTWHRAHHSDPWAWCRCSCAPLSQAAFTSKHEGEIAELDPWATVSRTCRTPPPSTSLRDQHLCIWICMLGLSTASDVTLNQQELAGHSHRASADTGLLRMWAARVCNSYIARAVWWCLWQNIHCIPRSMLLKLQEIDWQLRKYQGLIC